MKKLLLAASMAAGIAACAVPAFAQAATTSQPGWVEPGDDGAAGSVQAQNYNPTRNYNQTQLMTGDIPMPHIGGGGPNYLMHKQELQNMPGYSIGAGG